LEELTNKSPLSFPLMLIDGTSIETIGEAARYFSALSAEQKQKHYWVAAIRMLNNTLQAPVYLKTTTISIRTALLMDGLLLAPMQIDAF